MRLLFYVLLIAGFSCASSFAQQPQSTPPPPPPSSTPVPQSTPLTQTVRPIGTRRSDSPFARSTVSESDQLASRIILLHEFINPIYRKPTNREMGAVSPSPQVLNQYSKFLDAPNTGIFKLVADFGCAANDKVINARKECLIYSLPGAGNSFSFRTENHRIRHLADISLAGENLVITGIFMHGLVADVGNVPIEAISMNSPAMKFIAGFAPSTKSDNLSAIDNKFSQGIEQDGIRYAKEVVVLLGSTYVFRSVAYRGKVMRSARGVAYNELNYDKRRDVTVAFQIVERGADGSVTIIWKRLADKESPKIKMPKEKKQGDENINEP